MRFWAWALSVTFPLDLDLVVAVLELRANDALERRRLQTKKTRRRRRNVIGITATWIPWKILLSLSFSADQPVNHRPETLRVKHQRPMRKKTSYCDGK
jgi:hypothetical protein